MMNIDKRHIIDSSKLSREFYFTSMLQEAYDAGLLQNNEMENIQLQCISLLANKSEGYSQGKSSSIRIEVAESIMKSNLYTIGLYLKSLPDADTAVREFKITPIQELYNRGRKLINRKLHAAKHLYILCEKNKLATPNYTYNATLNENGIGIFFEAYNPDYEAHETPASIDYQLCCPVTDLSGVEFIQKYLENLFYENEFCGNFSSKEIHYMLCGYDEGYSDLLINIFEQVLTAALGCALAGRSALKLNISEPEIMCLHKKLSKYDDYLLAANIHGAVEKVLEELRIESPSLRRYVENSMHKISANILNAVRTNTLNKTIVTPVNQDLVPRLQFLSGVKMEDWEYREIIEELMTCRYSSDRLALIKEKVKSFGDLEDVLLDVQLSAEEITSIFETLNDAELAALIKRYPFKSDIQAVELTEEEQKLRIYLKGYIDQLPLERQEYIFRLQNQLAE